MYIHIYVYAYMHICIYVHAHTYTSTYVCTYAYVLLCQDLDHLSSAPPALGRQDDCGPAYETMYTSLVRT